MRTCLPLVLVAALGCVHAYTEDEQQEILKRVKVGETMQETIRQEARKPDGVFRRDGREYWIWAFKSQTPGHGGAPTETRVVEVEFDEKGVVTGVRVQRPGESTPAPEGGAKPPQS
jgi:hypothetical protein